MRFRNALAVTLVLAALSAVPAQSQVVEQAQAPGTTKRYTHTAPAGARSYELHVPASYDPAKGPRPLVVYLHGCTQTAADAARGTRFDALSEREGVLVAYPEQDPNANGSRCWNWFLPAHQTRDSGEASIIAGITREVMARFAVDANRVYVNGVSAGGAMAVIMGATHPDLYAAIGVHAGCVYRGLPCLASASVVPPSTSAQWAYEAMGPRARVVPVFAAQGDLDVTVPAINTEQVVEQWLTTNELADDGAANASARTTKATTSHPAEVAGGHVYDIDAYTDAAGCRVVERWLVHGMSHAYSGGSSTGTYTDPKGPDVTTAAWKFFSAHPKHTGRACSAPANVSAPAVSSGSAAPSANAGASAESARRIRPSSAKLPATGPDHGGLPASLALATALLLRRRARARRAAS